MSDYYRLSGTSHHGGYAAGSAVPTDLCVLYPFFDGTDWWVHADIGGIPTNWVRISGGPYVSEPEAVEAITRMAHPLDPDTLA